MAKQRYVGGVPVPENFKLKFIALFNGKHFLGLYASDDQDVVKSLDTAARFDNTQAAKPTVAHANTTWSLNQGEVFRSISATLARRLIAEVAAA